MALSMLLATAYAALWATPQRIDERRAPLSGSLELSVEKLDEASAPPIAALPAAEVAAK